jgi:hypothetical protein
MYDFLTYLCVNYFEKVHSLIFSPIPSVVAATEGDFCFFDYEMLVCNNWIGFAINTLGSAYLYECSVRF